MAQIEELQARVTRALDRIASGLDKWEPAATEAELAAMRGQTEKAMTEAEEARAALAEMQAAAEAAPEPEPAPAPEPQADPEELAQVRAALDDEKMANAQLEERLRTLGARQDSETATLREQLASQREAMSTLDGELQRLRAANDALSATSAALRDANAKGVGEPHLINSAMLAELEAMRATRASEAAEVRAVMEAINPLLAPEAPANVETPGAPDQEETV